MEGSRRIYVDGGGLDGEQSAGLFWVKEGRVFCFVGAVNAEGMARVYRVIQEFYPLSEVAGERLVSCLEGAEECVQVSGMGEVVSVRQIGDVKIGNVKLLFRKLKSFLGLP